MKKLQLILLSTLLIIANGVLAQERTVPQNFYVKARLVDEQVVGKIIPGNQAAWYLGMKHGYTVSLALADGKEFGAYEILEAELLPAPESAFENSSLPPAYADVMRRMIYEEKYTVPGKSFDDMLMADKAMSRMYFSYLLVSAYDPQISELSGLQFALPNALGNRYKIKVEVNGYPSYANELELFESQLYSDSQSPAIEIKQGDKTAKLQWNHSDFKSQFVAYQVERSLDGTDYQSLGTPRIFNGESEAGKLGMVTYVDSLPENYINYWYRVRGYDAFGYLSIPNDGVRMHGKDMIPPRAPSPVRVEQVAPSVVNLNWGQVPVDDLKGFQVIASMTEQGEYQRLHADLLSPEERFFQFDISDYLFRYYRVLAVDTARNASASDLAYLVVYDTIPPAVPTDLRVEVDSNRVVHLSWSASASEDIKGYRLTKAYHPSQGFTPITPKPVKGLSFTDSVPQQRIDRKVYYQLIALDQHFNHSAPAPFVAAPIPDDKPPTTPLMTSAEMQADGSVALSWKGSSSADVASYVLFRTLEGDSVQTEMPIQNPQARGYTDIKTDVGNFHFATYSVVAIDSSGNVSEHSNAKRVFSKQEKAGLHISISNAAQVGESVQLDWAYSSDTEHSILIYRKEGDRAFDLLARAEGNGVYVDKAVNPGETYSYKIGVLEISGRKSPLSDSVSLKVK